MTLKQYINICSIAQSRIGRSVSRGVIEFWKMQYTAPPTPSTMWILGICQDGSVYPKRIDR